MQSTADVSFDDLLEMAEQNVEAKRELERRLGANVAVLVVDFSVRRRRKDAFSRVSKLRTARRAIRHYSPAVSQRGGQIVATKSDTIVGVFERAPDALMAALEGNIRMKTFNGPSTGDVWAGPPGDPIYPRAGLGFGSTVLGPGGQFDGPEVNRAFVLGTGVARAGEILISSAFVEELGTPPSGVGLHGSRQEREAEAGFPFHICTDYRAEDG